MTSILYSRAIYQFYFTSQRSAICVCIRRYTYINIYIYMYMHVRVCLHTNVYSIYIYIFRSACTINVGWAVMMGVRPRRVDHIQRIFWDQSDERQTTTGSNDFPKSALFFSLYFVKYLQSNPCVLLRFDCSGCLLCCSLDCAAEHRQLQLRYDQEKSFSSAVQKVKRQFFLP